MPRFSLDKITQSPFFTLLTYPGGSETRSLQIYQELQGLHIEELIDHGTVNAGGQRILGLGYCGLVLLGQWHGEQVAIKIHRSDGTQPNLRQEAEHLQFANRSGVGPRHLANSDHVLVMEYLPGTPLGDWLQSSAAEHDKKLLKNILDSLLQDAFELDQAGLDHGALRCVAEHAIVGQQRAKLIDFSHASRNRRAANVTTLVQGLFWGTRLAEDLGRHLRLPNRDTLIPLLQKYKQQRSIENFNTLRHALLA